MNREDYIRYIVLLFSIVLFSSCAIREKENSAIINDMQVNAYQTQEETLQSRDSIHQKEIYIKPTQNQIKYINICKQDSLRERLFLPNGYVDILFNQGPLSVVNYDQGFSYKKVYRQKESEQTKDSIQKKDSIHQVYIDREVVKVKYKTPRWAYLIGAYALILTIMSGVMIKKYLLKIILNQ